MAISVSDKFPKTQEFKPVRDTTCPDDLDCCGKRNYFLEDAFKLAQFIQIRKGFGGVISLRLFT
jgi:hypothetical protein